MLLLGILLLPAAAAAQDAMALQQEIQEKEGHLEQAYSRLEAGEAPDDEIAKEWIRMLQKKSQNLKSMVTSCEVFAASYTNFAGNIRTT